MLTMFVNDKVEGSLNIHSCHHSSPIEPSPFIGIYTLLDFLEIEHFPALPCFSKLIFKIFVSALSVVSLEVLDGSEVQR